MNTIKIYLDQSGELADLQKDFPLYQYQFNNKLLNIYIPRVLLGASQFVDDNINSGNACLVKMSYTMDWNGKTKTSDAFLCRYVKDVTQNGITYSLFERTLPYAFTLYAGQGAGAPQLTVMACNVVEGSVISTISSQPVALDVIESSTIFDVDDIPQSTALTDLESQLNTAIANLALKQDKVDPTINPSLDDPDTNDHSVVGNINTLIQNTNDNASAIGSLDGRMDTAEQNIHDLQVAISYGVNIVGTMTVQDGLPTDSDVSDYVTSQTGEAPVRGQAVIVRVDYTAGTDTIYLYVYDGANWSHFEMQFLNSAANGVKGLIQGNYDISELVTPDTYMVDIVNGEIQNIYRVDSNGNHIDLKSAMDQVIAKLVGNVPVNRATADKNGNDIAATYQTKLEGASKDYVKQYASPKALYDLNYPDYALGQFKNATVSDTSYNKTTNSTSVGYTTLATITKSLEADILLGDQNGLVNRLWISANITEDVKLRITTAYIDGNNQTQTLSVEETDTFGLVAGIAKLLQIESVFSGLTQPITLPAGTTLVQTIEVWREASASADFTLLSNTTYNAYMTLNKIGYVRYALEQEPSAIETGHDSAPTIDSDGDLLVQSIDGKMHYANSSEQEIATILKVPMASGINAGDVRPPKAGDVKTALDGKLTKQIGTSTYPQAYTKGVDGTQAMMDITDSTANNSIVRRNGQHILVPATPTADNHATSKKYVDGKFIKDTNTFIPSSNWTSGSGDANYPYYYDLSITGVTSTMMAIVSFKTSGVVMAKVAPYCETQTGIVRFFAKENLNASVDVAGIMVIGN